MFLSLLGPWNFSLECENGLKFPVWFTTVQNRGRVLINSSPAGRGGLKAVSSSLTGQEGFSSRLKLPCALSGVKRHHEYCEQVGLT